ncbi:hypothetical protein [Rhodococcus sp. MS16]|uniref:hypothetical protein n=1 Tax=Rhodococcus sp. MS16 TaxID=2579941 RepID=UPI001562D9E0|nr:hypothetical protein [Rhodococcus sp. MS16]
MIAVFLLPSRFSLAPHSFRRCFGQAHEQKMLETRDRAELRMALGITSLPALKSRRVRNSIEHFDDRLDNFFSNAEGSSTIAERIIGPIDTITVGDIPVRYLRHLDLDDDTFTVLEDSVSLGDLTEAVDEVARKAEAWLQSNMPGMQTVRWL